MSELEEMEHFIDGEWTASAAASLTVENPATGEPITDIPVATDKEITRALRAASSAQDSWGERPGIERAEILREIVDVVESHGDSIAEWLVTEQGKPVSAARGEVAATANLARYVAGWGRRLEGEIVPSDNRDEQIHIQRHPVGTVVGIVPWNYPIAVFMRKLLPPLIAGNSVVIKPSELTPLATVRLVETIAAETSLPDGVVNLVLGDGSVGEALVTGKQTDMVTMTGSVATGKAIMRAAADRLTPVSLELGGKAPAIVCADADIDAAVEDILTARITNAGQVCTCAERVYVESGVADEFTEKFVNAARALTMDHPTADADMGPQVSASELEKTEAAVRTAVDAGATVRVGGGQPEGEQFESGYWFEPTVLTDVEQSMDVVQEEVFGPVTPIVSVDSVDEAIAHANDSRYGLSSYVYTTDYQTAMCTAQDLEYGETYLNRTLGEAWQGFHTGWKESGLGGEDGKHGVLKYTRMKSVYYDYA